MSEFQQQVASGERFEFGRNWSAFLGHLSEERILEAERSLSSMLGMERLDGKRFLDIGSGSGLFSLAARRLGADVTSFDFDPSSVECTRTLRERFFSGDTHWKVMQGSVLDESFVGSLETFDIVYSWGVLHHTGQMWRAVDAATRRVGPGGRLFIALYNDQGRTTHVWKAVKRSYNKLPPPLRFLVLWPAAVRLWGPTMTRDLLQGRPGHTWKNYISARGMSAWTDVVDWVGGYPFEVAKPEEVFEFARARGFELEKLVTCGGGLGCNEYVFRRIQPG